METGSKSNQAGVQEEKCQGSENDQGNTLLSPRIAFFFSYTINQSCLDKPQLIIFYLMLL